MSNTRQAEATSRWRALIVFAAIAVLFVLEGTTRNAMFSGSWNTALAILNMGLISAVMALGVNMQWGYAGLFNAGVVGFIALGALGPVLVATAPVEGAWAAGGLRVIAALVVGFGTLAMAAQVWARVARGWRVPALIATLIVAFVAGLARLSRNAWLRWLSTGYIEFFRGTSIFVQLFWIYFVLPMTGIQLSPMQAGVMALGLNVGAYGAEVVRGAVLSVPRDQHEACTAVNLTRFQRMRHVILPQALPLMLPTFGNNAIELMKATSVVSLISLSDMTFQAQVVRSQTGSTLLPFVTILLLYFVLSSVISFVMRRLERRVTRGLDGVR